MVVDAPAEASRAQEDGSRSGDVAERADGPVLLANSDLESLFATPAAADAIPIIPGGSAVTVNVTPTAPVDLTFNRADFQRISIVYSNFGLDRCGLGILGPRGNSIGTSCFRDDFGNQVFGAQSFDRYFPGNAHSGQYTIRINSDQTGPLTVRVHLVPADLVDGIQIGGPPVRVEIAVPGHFPTVTFNGSAGQMLRLDVSDSTIRTSCNVRLHKPTGPPYTFFQDLCIFGAELLPPLAETGVYRIEITPSLRDQIATGQVTLRLYSSAALPPVCVSGRVKPIVLVHGFGGSVDDFNDLRPFLLERVRAEFREAGATAEEAALCAPVFVTAVAVGPQASSAANGLELQQKLTEIASRAEVTPIDIVAHSKGGLDSRTAIENMTIVRNLVMIGTPNGGTLIADALCGVYDLSLGNPITDPAGYLRRLAAREALRRLIDRIAGKCRGEQDALYGLTRDFVRETLNRRVQDNPDVLYQTIAGDSPCIVCRALRVVMGGNDGRVPVSSVEFLAERGHISAGVFPDEHTELLHSTDVATRAYCSLVPRGQHYGPCDVEPDAAAATAAVAADTPEAVLHVDGLEVPAAGSASRTLPIGGRGPVDVTILTEAPVLTASASGATFTAEPYFGGRALSARIQSASDLPLTLSNPGGELANALIVVTGAATAGLTLRVTPEVAAPGQQVQIRVVGAPAGTTGLVGTVVAPDGTETVLTFAAAGTDAVASFTPAATGDYGVSVTHEGAAQRVVFGRLLVGSGSASLPGTFTASLATGPDGLADALNVNVNVTVAQAGAYTLSGGLAAADGTLIGTAEATGSLSPGDRQLRLSYRGPVLYAAGRNGPYHLVGLTLERSGVTEARVGSTAPTAGYQFTVFRPALVVPAAASVTEGNSGTTVVEFPVTLSERVNVPVTAEFVSINQPGSATWPDDYDVVWDRLTFLPGETAKTVSLTIRGDVLDENDEMALVHFYTATNARVGGFGGVGGVVIVDDDALPVIQPGFATATTEGNTGNTVVQVPVTLSAPSGRTVTVRYAPYTQDGFATFPGDFDAPSATLTFQPGETAKTVPLTIKGDLLDEADEAALIALTSPTNATVGGFGVAGVTIVDDDPMPVIQPGFASITEGNSGTKVIQVPVTLSAPSGQTVTVNYGSLNQPGGYASWPEDYEPILGTLTFLPGETAKTLSLTIKGDTLAEADEMALTAFSGAVNATIGGFGVAGVTITNDD